MVFERWQNVDKWFRRWLLSTAMLFVFAQTAALLHAEIHPFHEHSEACDVYEKLAQPASGLADIVSTVPTLWRPQTLPDPAAVDPSLVFAPFFYSRAPPQS